MSDNAKALFQQINSNTYRVPYNKTSREHFVDRAIQELNMTNSGALFAYTLCCANQRYWRREE